MQFKKSTVNKKLSNLVYETEEIIVVKTEIEPTTLIFKITFNSNFAARAINIWRS